MLSDIYVCRTGLVRGRYTCSFGVSIAGLLPSRSSAIQGMSFLKDGEVVSAEWSHFSKLSIFFWSLLGSNRGTAVTTKGVCFFLCEDLSNIPPHGNENKTIFNGNTMDKNHYRQQDIGGGGCFVKKSMDRLLLPLSNDCQDVHR